jgi:regulatory protein
VRRRHPKTDAAAAEADERTVRTAALALLAGRDFGRAELTKRLRDRGYADAVIDESLRNLAEQGLLREERFLDQFLTQHAGRGHGPMRIRMELRQRGVEGEAVDGAFDRADTDWVQAAREARRRKFGSALPADHRERAKQARFLQYRGFSSDQVRAALGPDEDDPDP